MESDDHAELRPSASPSGATDAIPIYTWNFGDGSPTVTGYAPGAASLNSPERDPLRSAVAEPLRCQHLPLLPIRRHLQVTLTVKDVGGNEASVTNRVVTVAGPAVRQLAGRPARPAPRSERGPASATAPGSRRSPPASRPPGSPPQSGRHPGRRLPQPRLGPAQRPGRPLLGQRTGRRALRGAARELDRHASSACKAHRRPAWPKARRRRRSSPKRSS